MQNDFNKIDPFFESSLRKSQAIYVSTQPEVPGKDEKIRHKLLSHNFIQTTTGLTLFLDLHNTETKEEYTYSFPDIQDVVENSSSTAKNQKYYLHCLDRAISVKQEELKNIKKSGVPLSEKDLNLLSENNTYTHRITLHS